MQLVSISIKFDFFEIACTCFAGLMSGLTVGILSIDMLDLELKLAIGSEAERKNVSYSKILKDVTLGLKCQTNLT